MQQVVPNRCKLCSQGMVAPIPSPILCLDCILQVSPHYDSLLGKLMVWAPTRKEAVQKMAAALQATKLQGTPNNLPLLKVGAWEPMLPVQRLPVWQALILEHAPRAHSMNFVPTARTSCPQHAEM